METGIALNGSERWVQKQKPRNEFLGEWKTALRQIKNGNIREQRKIYKVNDKIEASKGQWRCQLEIINNSTILPEEN